VTTGIIQRHLNNFGEGKPMSPRSTTSFSAYNYTSRAPIRTQPTGLYYVSSIINAYKFWLQTEFCWWRWRGRGGVAIGGEALSGGGGGVIWRGWKPYQRPSGRGLNYIFPFGITTRRCKLHLLAVIQIEQDSIYNITKQAKPECRDVNIISRIAPQSTT
jgi:hypothetical protein